MTTPSQPIGQTISHYRILEKLGVRSQNALNTWSRRGKDADPDIPILKQGKAEYAKLQ